MSEQGHYDAEAPAGASWSWEPDEWGWTPTVDPMLRSFGAPPPYARMSVSTAPVAPPERYRFWRNIVWPDWDSDEPTPAQREDFHGRADGLFCGPRTLVTFESDPTSGGRVRPPAADQGGAIHLGLVLGGERLSETSGDRQHQARMGDLYAYDPDRDAKVAWPRRHRGVNLMIPREALTQIFGPDVPPPTVLLGALASSALAPLVSAQFRLLAQQAPLLTDLEADAGLGGAIDLILAALRSGQAFGAAGDGAFQGTSLLVAARRYIDIHLGERELDAARLATALGCSRATLYRAFAERDLTVAEAIRDARLGRFRAMLRDHRAGASIAQAAIRCGLGDARTARRLFKATFGVSPLAFRAAEIPAVAILDDSAAGPS